MGPLSRGFLAVFAAATNTPLACTIMGVELFGRAAQLQRKAMQRTAILALVLLCCLGSVALAGDDSKDDGHAIPGHHIETSGGVAYHDGKSGAYTAIEYEYRFSQLVGVGAFADTTFGGFDLAAFGAVAKFYPQGGW